jgi:ABC-2 type transport system ATP-binding protein
MDEPTSGLDPIGRREVRNLLVRLKKEGKTIFLCSHLLSEMERISSRVGIMHEGRLLKLGSLDDLLSPKQQTLEDLFIEIVEGGNE